MTIEKLPSGNYRIKQMVSGKMFSVVVDHRPSKVEAEQIMADKIRRKPSNTENMTLKDACELYIDSRRKVISASTIDSYRSMVRNIPHEYLSLHLGQITAITVQQFINEYSNTHGNSARCKEQRSPKTVANMSRFIMSVLKFTDIIVKSPQLPQRVKKEPYIPSNAEVHAILDYVSGTDYEIPFRLAARGLRKSEILALTVGDLNGTDITINKALVIDENNNMVLKSTKTTESTRTIEISKKLAGLIRKKGCIYSQDPKTASNAWAKKLRKAQDDLNIEHFGFHKFRHFYASFLYQLGFPPKYIQEDGGWSTDEIMKTVYTHVLNKTEVKHQISVALSEFS